MPIAVGAFDVDAIFGVDDRHHRVAHVTPGMGIGELRKDFHVDRHTTILHVGGGSDERTAVQSDRQLDLGQHAGQQQVQCVNVACAVTQDLLTLLERERPALHDPLLHRVLALAVGVVKAVVGQRPQQALARWHGAAVGDAAEFGVEVEHVGRQWPA